MATEYRELLLARIELARLFEPRSKVAAHRRRCMEDTLRHLDAAILNLQLVCASVEALHYSESIHNPRRPSKRDGGG